MAKRRVFVSHDYNNSKHYRFLLNAWDQNPNFDFYMSDFTPAEIKTMSIPRVKAGLTLKLKQADYLMVIICDQANKWHPDCNEIGYKNWINYEIAKAKELGLRLVAVKTDWQNESPDEIYNSGAAWARRFTKDAILNALDNA